MRGLRSGSSSYGTCERMTMMAAADSSADSGDAEWAARKRLAERMRKTDVEGMESPEERARAIQRAQNPTSLEQDLAEIGDAVLAKELRAAKARSGRVEQKTIEKIVDQIHDEASDVSGSDGFLSCHS